MSPLVAGVMVAAIVAALILVFRDGSRSGRSWTRATTNDRDVVSESARLDAALIEIAFDRTSGKLAEADYQAFRQTYEAGLARAAAAPTPRVGPDAAEELVARARAQQSACPSCGPRPEPSPAYCSTCGRHLLACRRCGARPDEVGARFCAACGARLAA